MNLTNFKKLLHVLFILLNLIVIQMYLTMYLIIWGDCATEWLVCMELQSQIRVHNYNHTTESKMYLHKITCTYVILYSYWLKQQGDSLDPSINS